MKTPVFILEEEKLKENYRDFNKLCQKLGKFKIAYSVKTNSERKAIVVLEKEGSGFEVASLDELKKVDSESFVVFNGPAKTTKELKIAIRKKILINVDSKSIMPDFWLI